MSSFAWDDVCAHVISMPNSHVQRAAVMQQLDAIGLPRSRMHEWMGLPLKSHPEQIEPAVQKAASSCLVPQSYAVDNQTSAKWRGTIGSTLAHLLLLRDVWLQSTLTTSARDECASAKWALVLADDVVLLQDFKAWLADQMDAAGSSADFVNLAVVRAWGPSVAAAAVEHKDEPRGSARPRRRHLPVVQRVSGSIGPWPQWSNGRPALHHVRNPNILVSAYVVRVATLPTLLSSFGATERFGRRCSIDQVLGRIEYALASAGRYTSFNIDAERSFVGHCAVGPEETSLWEQRAPLRHRACMEHHASIYGQGSRSHDRRRLSARTRRRRLAASAASAVTGEEEEDDDEDEEDEEEEEDEEDEGPPVSPRERARKAQQKRRQQIETQQAVEAQLTPQPPSPEVASSALGAPTTASSTLAASRWLQQRAERLVAAVRAKVKTGPAGDGTRAGGDRDGLGCSHDFRVPLDRVTAHGGALATVPKGSGPLLDERAWAACARAAGDA